jgi:hypothetical protein
MGKKFCFIFFSVEEIDQFAAESLAIGPHGRKFAEWNVLTTSSEKLEIIVFVLAVETSASVWLGENDRG